MKSLWQSQLIKHHGGSPLFASRILAPLPLALPAQVATVLASALLGLAAHAQGTVNFANLGNGLDRPIYMNDWITKVPSTGFTAELLAGTTAANLQSVATTGFLASAPGYFNGGVVTIPDIPAGSQAFFEIRVWSMASGSYAAAQAASIPNTFGASSLFAVTLGGAGGNPPATLSTFQGFSLGGFPEPPQFYYTTNDNTITITGCTGARGTVTIPNTINGLPVTSIGDDAFSCGGKALTSITIPDSVTNIGAFAFNGCTSLTNVDLGNGAVSIGAYAFSYCTSLTNVSIPASVTSIGEFAFGCPDLVEITVSPLNTTYSSKDGVLFDKNQITLVEFPVGKAGGYVIPDTVTSIGDSAFLFCPNLTSVTMPHTVTNIGDSAFSNCAGLTNVIISDGTANIGSFAFGNCVSLTSVLIPRSVISIGDEAFGGCFGLNAIGVDASNSVYSSVDGVLLNRSRNTLLQYPAAKTGSYAIPGSVALIGDYAFANCTSLTGIVLPITVTNLGSGAFEGCLNLTSVTIPGSIIVLSNGVFEGCTGLTNATIGDGVIEIGEEAFGFCPCLASVTIPDSVRTIGGGAFEFTALTHVGIPDGVTAIDSGAFYECTNLTSVNLPEGLTSIAGYLFEGCTSLSDITIPNLVTNIGDYAFASCNSLKGVYVQGNAPALGSDAFSLDDSAIVHYLPGTTGWGSTFGGLPTEIWSRVILTTERFDVPSRVFSFDIISPPNLIIVVEASTNLNDPNWLPLRTNVLTSGSAHFSDPNCTNCPARLYRVRSQ